MWSSKLHDLLKPRRHLLIEPQSQFIPYLQPLLDAPKSHYSLVNWNPDPKEGAKCWDSERYIADGLLPDQGGLDPSSPSKLGQNNSLLIIVNTDLGRLGVDPKSSPFSHRAFWRFTQAVSDFSGLHRGGAVRMLMWVSDQEKVAILPRTVWNRRRLAVEGEGTCRIEELAGGIPRFKMHRHPVVDVDSCSRVMKHMENGGIHIPANRLDELPRLVLDNPDSERSILSTLQAPREWQQELRLLEEELAEGKFSRYLDYKPDTPKKKLTADPKFRRLARLRSDDQNQKMQRGVLEDLIKADQALDSAVLAALKDPTLSDQKREKRLKHLDLQMLQHTKKVNELPKKRLVPFHSAMLDRRAFYRNPPLLLWDQRRFEPIIAKDDEFFSSLVREGSLALLDIQPRTDSTLPKSLSPSQQAGLEFIRRSVCPNPSDLLMKSLDGLAPGAAQAIIARAPSLRDPQKGGRRNVNEMRVGLLTTEMYREMAIAWDSWEFKPSSNDMRRTRAHTFVWYDRKQELPEGAF